MCLHSSAPCFLSGPHFGTISDIKLYRMYTPQLAASECILGDKAYCDQNLVNTIITPIKKQKRKRLSDEENEYNKLHGWYRSSIEHTFGFMKRFRIISNIFINACSMNTFIIESPYYYACSIVYSYFIQFNFLFFFFLFFALRFQIVHFEATFIFLLQFSLSLLTWMHTIYSIILIALSTLSIR